MPVFRRSSAGETDSKAAGGEAEQAKDTPAKTKPPTQAGKGRPTPKRSEAERNRYRSIQGGTTSGRTTSTVRDPGRKLTPEEKARDKDRVRAERARRSEAMRRGEDWALGPRDRGPLRKLARDYVDSRRRVSEYMMYGLVVLLVAMFSRNAVITSYVTTIMYVMFAAIIVDGYLIGRALRKLAAERFPGQSTRGLALYAVMRAMYVRRWRFPKPQVQRGDKI